MNLVYILPTLNKVAPITVIINIIKILYRSNNIQVITLKSSRSDNYISELTNLNIEIVKFKNILKAIRNHEKINFNHVDIIHLNGLQPNIYGTYLKRKYPHLNSLTTAHSIENIDFVSSRGFIKGTIGYLLNSFFYKYHNSVIAVSNDVKKYLISQNIKNISVINNGLDINRFSKLKKVETKKISLVHVGKVNRNKNQLYTLKLLNYLLEFNIKIKLTIIGKIEDTDYKRDLDKYISENRLTNQVYFLGNLDFSSLCNELSHQDILIMPSSTEGLPLSPLEGYFYNLPAISSTNGGLKEVVIEDKTGILIDINNEKSFDKIRDFIESGRYKIISKEVKSFLFTNFTSEIMAQKYFNIYKELIDEKTN